MPSPMDSSPLYDSNVFGHIPKAPIGKTWKSRVAMRRDGVHSMTQRGVQGNSIYGAYAVVLNGGYEDNEDHGNTIIYAGCGGKSDPGDFLAKKSLTGPQRCDQTLDSPGNRALLKSLETGEPIRVLRGSRLTSRYAPPEGYRYDGLYHVTKAWYAKGKMGFMVYKFKLERDSGQPPLSIGGGSRKAVYERIFATSRRLKRSQ